MLAQLVTSLRDLLEGELGIFKQTNFPAIAVDPGPIPNDPEGIRLIIRRFPISNSRKVSAGTYYPDLFKIELTQFIPYSSYSNQATTANLMSQAIRKIENNFEVVRTRYIPPNEESYERCLMEIFVPSLSLEV